MFVNREFVSVPFWPNIGNKQIFEKDWAALLFEECKFLAKKKMRKI